jgi:hypothetical protein
MSKTMSKTKAQLEQELAEVKRLWMKPDLLAELVTDRETLSEQLSTQRQANDDLLKNNKLLEEARNRYASSARRDQEALTRLETELEQLIPPEFLGDNWDDLVLPLRQYIKSLQTTACTTYTVAQEPAVVSIPSFSVAPKAVEPVQIPITIDLTVKVQHG